MFALPAGYGSNFTPVRKKMKVLDCCLRSRSILLQSSHGAKKLSSRNVVVNNALYGTESNKVREIVEVLAPSRLRLNQPKPLPVG